MDSVVPNTIEGRIPREPTPAPRGELSMLHEHPSSPPAAEHDIAKSSGPTGSAANPPRRRRGIFGTLILLLLAAVVAGVGVRVWNYLDTYESTDDAQIDGHVAPISARIEGTIAHVYVQDTDYVQAGALIAQIDPRDAQTALASTRANLAQSRAQLDSARADYGAALSKIRQSEAVALQARNDANRYDSLFNLRVVSTSEHDDKVRAASVADATVESDHASAEAARTQIASREAAVNAAQAAVDQALLNLEYTRITAPMSGIIGKKTVEDGERVQPGQQLLAIVPLNDIWITANFKETQIRRMRRGQRATIYVDAIGRDYQGYVEGVGGASGEKYSLMPPENATGNYVKVVQRLPIRIRLREGQDADHRLRVGMSVEATVRFR
ncbi:MAG TPA: HlyD family secretion protein [Candidatus Binataceae bacterium]|nr:HlyD family secretion protein [Candidatus Binataceae bacterium]